jgi:16S rRNA (guanine527-N7)-methyltransferase
MSTEPSEADWRARLAAGAERLGIVLSPAQTAQCWQLALLLRERNAAVNLTAIDSLEGILTLHMLDSLAVAPHLGAARRIVDVGTGGGFPGLPLAIACPEREFLLIDGTQKKIKFVSEAIDALGLRNATAEATRAELLKPAARCDVVLVRAVGSLAELVRVTRHLIAPGGRLLALKGKRPDAELAALPPGWRAAATALNVPALDAERTLVVITPSTGKSGG